MDPHPHDPRQVPFLLTVLAPAHNEQENIGPLVQQVGDALDQLDPAQGGCEFILVDDGSTDDTRARALELAADRPWLRVLVMTNTPAGRGNGQSAAFHAGIRAGRGRLIALLDADLQNDPADLPAMLAVMAERDADMVQGDRSADRRDTIVRRASSVVGRLFRRWLLGDTIRDTGCSLRIMKRELALALPLQFKGMHRFIPITARQLGYTVVEVPVHHRARVAGEAKYGIWNRAIPGLIDCFAMRWMHKRRRPVTAKEPTACRGESSVRMDEAIDVVVAKSQGEEVRT
ncbi:MAG: glycosyltransferase family 2 protein [Phycisphaerales bacterium]|nr:glycosyltransferase family 2 protein [Phycisphaerales bacterium]